MGCIKHLDLTLSGAAQNLGGALTAAQLTQLVGQELYDKAAAAGLATRDIAAKYTFRTISFQGDPANANPIYVGGENATVSSSSWGWLIPAAVAGVASPPLIYDIGPPAKLTDFFVLGTANQILHILVQEM